MKNKRRFLTKATKIFLVLIWITVLFTSKSSFFLQGACPAFAMNGKDIDLDLQNVQPEYASFIKPYLISARKKIEAEWDMDDPRYGKTVRIFFLIARTGDVTVIQPITATDPVLQKLAASAVLDAQPYGIIPDTINALQIVATFRSKNPPLIRDKSAFVNNVAQTLIAAGFLALAGYAIYQLGKNNNANTVFYQPRGPGCIGLMDCRVCEHCMYCEYCKTAAVPCGKYYLGQ